VDPHASSLGRVRRILGGEDRRTLPPPASGRAADRRLGLVVDRRGRSLPLALLALLVMLFGAAFVMYGGLGSQ